MLWGCFPGVDLVPLAPVKGNLNTKAYQDILDKCVLLLWEQFWESQLWFQHDCAPGHKARSIKASLGEFGVVWKPIEHL